MNDLDKNDYVKRFEFISFDARIHEDHFVRFVVNVYKIFFSFLQIR